MPTVPAKNESEWSNGGHSCPKEARQVGWQKRSLIKLMFRDEGFCEDHRSVVVGQHVESRDQDGGAGHCAERQHVEELQVQGDECVRDGRGGLGRKLMRWQSKCRLGCAEDQVSAGDRRASYVNRFVHGSDSTSEDSGRRPTHVPNTRHEVVVQMREQLRNLWPDGSCRSSLFGGVLWISQRQSQLESESGEAVRSNPTTRIHRVEDGK